jgi:hypothetical protein
MILCFKNIQTEDYALLKEWVVRDLGTGPNRRPTALSK